MSISVTLSPKVDHLWHSAHSLKNEMIVTAAGRKMFPCLEYCITGLDPLKMYLMRFHFELVDDKVLRFIDKKYVEVPSRETRSPPKKVWHHHAAQSGSYWMERGVQFDLVKITNRKSVEEQSPSTIHLLTQHRYLPVLEIYEDGKMIKDVRFKHTIFLPVTGYNNPAVNKFKSDNNPYARRFRTDYSRSKTEGKNIKKQEVATFNTPQFNPLTMFPHMTSTNSPPSAPPVFPMLPMFNPFFPMGLSYYNCFNPSFQFPTPLIPAVKSEPIHSCLLTPPPSTSPNNRKSPSSVNFHFVENFVDYKVEEDVIVD